MTINFERTVNIFDGPFYKLPVHMAHKFKNDDNHQNKDETNSLRSTLTVST